MSNDNLSKLEVLDRPRALASRHKAGPLTYQARTDLSKRGRVHADLGLPGNALEDSLRAYLGDEEGELARMLSDVLHRFKQDPSALAPTPTAPGAASTTDVTTRALSARLGEALRVYIRDVLLSRPPGGEPNVVDVVECSVHLFDRAETDLLATRGNVSIDDAELSWIRAHRGAARAINYWTYLANGSDEASAEATFAAADRDFEYSKLQNAAPYVWSVRFHAYLFSVRAQPRDFTKACDLLEIALKVDPCTQSLIERSRAMLFSYQAAAIASSLEDRTIAARAGIHAGAAATAVDPDDAVAAYFTAANWWSLATLEQDASKRETHQKAHRAAIETARTRSMNAISQALATLAGLQLMEILTPGPEPLAQTPRIEDAQVTKRVNDVLQSLQLDFPPDLETQLIFRRDPVWSTVKAMQAVNRQFNAEHEKLTQYCSALLGTRQP
jgi:hypothetical protein